MGMSMKEQKAVLAKATQDEITKARINTAMSDPQHMKAWLQKSNRRWLVFDSVELIDSLAWPLEVQQLMHLISRYTSHRATKQTGRTQTVTDPLTKEQIEVPAFKGDTLEYEELDRAIRYLVGQILALDPNWNLEGPAL